MASFIGKPISLISHSDVRYRGILAGIDPAASTIQLSNVYSMGTESRRPPAEFIPPVQEPYQYIIFRASEVKDLAVDEPAPRRSVHDDPAVLGASAPPPPTGTYTQYHGATQFSTATSSLPQSQPQLQSASSTQLPPQQKKQPPQQQDTAAPIIQPSQTNRQPGHAQRNNSVHTAAASLETVERALGDLRVSNGTAGGGSGIRQSASGGHGHGHGHGRRGQGHGPAHAEIKAGEIKVPATDFDFQSSNARFDKAALAPRKPASNNAQRADDELTNPSDQESKQEREEKEKERAAYNPHKSFFDSLSSSTHTSSGRDGDGGEVKDPGGRGGRRGGAGGRNRREEERERNVATFGEPGGVGLMGPGAYVGGWGGYGRRGSRPRRGGVGVGRT